MIFYLRAIMYMYLQKVKVENSRIRIHWSEARIRKEYFGWPQKDSRAVHYIY